MSTNYYFACDRCREYGGFFSRQAWGWGNMDIVDTFAFLANHADHVDHYQEAVELRVISEHDSHALEERGWTKTVNRADAEDGLAEHERVAAYERITFPHSDDWRRYEDLFAAYLDARKG